MNHHISVRQLRSLQLMAILPTTLVFIPGLMFSQSGASAFYAVTVAGLCAWGINYGIGWASDGNSPSRLFHRAWGSACGRWVTGLYAGSVMVGVISIWNELLIFVNASVLPRTPEWAIGLLIGTVTVVLVDGGIPGVARVTDLLVLGTILLGVIVIVPALGNIRWNHFVPLYPTKLQSIGAGIWVPISFLGESVVGVGFLSAVRERHPARLRAALVAGGALSAGVLAIVIFIVWGTLGAGYAAVLPYPFMETIRNIRWGELLSRFDLLFVPLWLGLIALKLAIWVIVAAHASRRAVRMGKARLWYIAVVGATLIPALMGFPTVSGRIAFLKHTWSDGAFPLLGTLIAVSGIASRWRRVGT